MNPRAVLSCLALALFFAPPIARAAEPVTLTGRAMGTTWTVKFLQPAPPAAPLDPGAVTAQVAACLEILEQQFSTYRPASELSRFNASASTDWIPVSLPLARVARESRRLSELTGGAFDVTVEPLVRLWGFGPERRPPTLPTAAEVAAARVRADYRRLSIRLSPPALKKDSPLVSADFSSMAKGFAADSLSALLRSVGAVDHFAQLGGDIKTSGHAADATAWRTGIENPLASPSATTIAAIVALSGQSLSTSGDARNFTLIAGRRYGHIIDPRTGRPAASALAAVSVVADSCATSSALATALFVLGPDAGFALATREHLAALFLVRDGEKLLLRPTPAFASFVVPAPLRP